jgi:hypothetical protein
MKSASGRDAFTCPFHPHTRARQQTFRLVKKRDDDGEKRVGKAVAAGRESIADVVAVANNMNE